MRHATQRALMIGTSSRGKLDIFGFFMVNYACSRMAERFHEVLGGLKVQKHSKNGLSATFCTSRNQSWEIEELITLVFCMQMYWFLCGFYCYRIHGIFVFIMLVIRMCFINDDEIGRAHV